MKRAERQHDERVAEERARTSAEWLGLKALLDRRIPESESLVIDMKTPLLRSDVLSDEDKGPTGVADASDVVARYAGVIAQRTGGDAAAVQQHFTELIGKERAATLGINLGKLKVISQPTAGGGTTFAVKLKDQEMIAFARYLASLDHLKFGRSSAESVRQPTAGGSYGSHRNADRSDRRAEREDGAGS